MNRSTLVLLQIILVGFLGNSQAVADDTVGKEICELAAKQQLRLEAISAFKLHGTFKIEYSNPELTDTESEVWMESRGEKIFLKYRTFKREGDVLKRPLAEIATLLDSDLSKILIFDGQKMIVHDPLKMLVAIEKREEFAYSDDLSAIHPRSWTNFSIKPTNIGKTSFSAFFKERLGQAKSSLNPEASLLAVSYRKDDKPDGRLWRMEIETQKGMIVRTELSGGIGYPIYSEMEWKESDKTWYVAKGKRTIGEGNAKRVSTWEIDEFTADPLAVRSNFTLDEPKLPLGTMIETEPQSRQKPRSIRYVGGEEGEREHKLKTQAIKIIFSKEGK
ncbi:MAG: hypothetical protein MUC83_10885 [Pirellula sp.]|nr:hypothetical protein [Pirellula sp.]